MTAMAAFGTGFASIFSMSDAVWERHANPWSVWTRVASGPLPVGAIFVHIWLGWPMAIFLFFVVTVWLWFNPRGFAPPTIMYFGKLWFCDRMVWLFDDMKSGNPTYRSWLR